MVHFPEISTTVTALLVIALLRSHPGLRSGIGRWPWRWMIAGVLLPFGDYIVPLLLAPDRIAFITRTQSLHGLYALGISVAVVGVVVWAIGGKSSAFRSMGCWAFGFLIHLLLAVLTPNGVPLFAPISSMQVALPILPVGHVLLLAVLTGGLVLVRLLPRYAPRIVAGIGGVLGVYFLLGLGQYLLLAGKVGEWSPPERQAYLEPAGIWPGQWRFAVTEPTRYRVGELNLWSDVDGEPKAIDRWNDQPELLRLLSDPIVNRFYHSIFRHPVVRLVISGTQTRLVMTDALDGGAAPAENRMIFEIRPEAESWLYRVEGFTF